MSDGSVQYEKNVPEMLKAMTSVHQLIVDKKLDATIHHLVQLRASQINKCGYCIDMHLREAREDGETERRLDRVIVWDQVDDFSDREKAALAWTEALTLLEAKSDLEKLRLELKQHFSNEEIGLLTGAVAMINLWNRINISRH